MLYIEWLSYLRRKLICEILLPNYVYHILGIFIFKLLGVFFFFFRSTQYALDATIVSYMFIFCAVHEKDAGQQSFESCFYKNPVAAGAIVPNPMVGVRDGFLSLFLAL